MCYVRQVLLHCCETLELTLADEAMLHRVECCMICIYYICIYHILSYTEYVQDIKSVSHGTWNKYPWMYVLMLVQFIFWSHIKEHKVEQVWAPPTVTVHVLSTSALAQRYFNFNLLPSSVASLTFSLRLIMNCDQAQYH